MKQIEVIISDLKKSPFQTREVKKTDDDIKELALSIKNVGLMHPIVVRQVANENGQRQYEIIAGHRRSVAATLAGMITISANLIDADDRKAAEMCILENMDRKDLTLHEEVVGVKNLLKGDLSKEEVATRLGRSRAWVRSREAIAELPEKYREELKAGGTLNNWSFEAVLALAKINACASKEAVDSTYKAVSGHIPTKEEIETYAKNNLCGNLETSAIFDTTECQKCLKRTGAQADLFGDVKDLGECLDRNCWKRKTNALRQKELNTFLKNNHQVINEVCRYKQGKIIFNARDVEDLELPSKAEQSYYWNVYDALPDEDENDAFATWTRVVYVTHEFDHKIEKNIWKLAVKFLREYLPCQEKEETSEEKRQRVNKEKAKELTENTVAQHIEKYIDEVVAGDEKLFMNIGTLVMCQYLENARAYSDDETQDSIINDFLSGEISKEALHKVLHQILVNDSNYERRRLKDIREDERDLDAHIHTELMQAMYGEDWGDKLTEMYEQNLKEIEEREEN